LAGRYPGPIHPFIGSRGFSNFSRSSRAEATYGQDPGWTWAYLAGEERALPVPERATYWAYRMVASEWAIAGDSAATNCRADSSNPPVVGLCGRQAGSCAVGFWYQQGPGQRLRNHPILPGFFPRPHRHGLTFDSSHYAWDTAPRLTMPTRYATGPVQFHGVSGPFQSLQALLLTVLRFTGSQAQIRKTRGQWFDELTIRPEVDHSINFRAVEHYPPEYPIRGVTPTEPLISLRDSISGPGLNPALAATSPRSAAGSCQAGGRWGWQGHQTRKTGDFLRIVWTGIPIDTEEKPLFQA